MNIRVFVWPGRVVAVLALVLAAIVATDLVLQKIEYDRKGTLDYAVHLGQAEPEPGVSYPGWLFEEIRYRFDLDQELNVASWYDALLLLLIALVMLSIAAALKQAGARRVWHWRIFAGIFALLSLDEVAMLHELLGGRPDTPGSWLTDLLGLRGSVYFDWVPVAAAFVVLSVFLFIPIFVHLPWRTALILGSAAAIYLTGTILVESLSGNYVRDHGWDSMTYRGLVALEESLEGIGSIVAIYGLLTYNAILAPEPVAQRPPPLGRLDLVYVAGIVFTFGLLAHVAIEVAAEGGRPDPQAITSLSLPVVSCGEAVEARFAWRPPAGAQEQWLELSRVDGDFRNGTFVSSVALGPRTNALTWPGLARGEPYYWRVKALTSEGWFTSATGSFVSCGPAVARGVTYVCADESGASVTFHWAPPAPPGLVSWLDLSLAPIEFAPGSFLSMGPLTAGQSEATWSGIPVGVLYYWRINTLFQDGWQASNTGSFVASCD